MSTKNAFTTMLGAVADTVAPAVTKPAAALVKNQPMSMHVDTKRQLLPAAVLGAAVGYKWKKHRLLGVIAGAGVGFNAYELAMGDHKLGTLADIAVPLAAVWAATKGKTTARKVIYFVGAGVGAAAATSLVPGSTAYIARHK